MASNTTPVMRSLTFLVLTTSAATVAGGQQPPAQARCRDCPPAEARANAEARAAQARDSVRVRSVGIGGDIERVAIELLTTRQLQLQAQQALNAISSGQFAEGTRSQMEMTARRLRQQIEQATRQSQTLRTQLAA